MDSTFDCQNERLVPRRIIHPDAALRSEPNPKQAYGDRKVALGLLPSAGLIACALAMMEGARKYGPFNWRDQPVELMTYYSASMRHVLAFIDGEDDDPETGYPHLGHAAACLFIMLDAIATDNAIDNRPTKGAAARLLRKYERRS